MKDLKLNIPADIKVEFLPTKRHGNWRVKLEHINIPVTVKELDDKEFPVAFRVTDFNAIIKGITKEEFDKLSGIDVKEREEYSYHKEDLRHYNGKIYAPYHINLYSTLNSTLVHEGTSKAEENISNSFKLGWIDTFGAKEFNKDTSVINTEQRKYEIDKAEKDAQKMADHYILYDGKLWHEVGEPYYHISHFGMTNSPGEFIEYARDEKLKYLTLEQFKKGYIYTNEFSCLHGKEFSETFKKEVLATKPFDKDLDYKDSEITKHNIEVLLPEVVRFKDFIDLEKENSVNLSLEEILKKDIKKETPIVKECKTPEESGKLFEAFATGIIKEQKKNKVELNVFLAAQGAMNLFSENNKKLLLQYYNNLGLNSKKAFENYFNKAFGLNKIIQNDKLISKSSSLPKKETDYDFGR